MSKYEEVFSENGLIELIKEAKEKIQEKQKEYQQVCEGKIYNPLCADGWKKEIQKDIEDLTNEISEVEEALRKKQSLNKI